MSFCLSAGVKRRHISLPLNCLGRPNIKPKLFKTKSLNRLRPGWETCFTF